MTQNTTTDERTAEMKRTMADHFAEFEAEYRTEPQNHEIVYEDDAVVVVRDHTGHELNEWADEFDMDRSEFSQIMHDLARQVYGRDEAEGVGDPWSVADPVVFDKVEV